MNQMLEWVRNIVLFQIFSIIFMGIFPKGENGKYIEMALNLLLIIVLISPVITYMKMDNKELENVVETFSNEIKDSDYYVNQEESICKSKENLTQKQIEIILKQSEVEGAVQVKVEENREMKIKWIRLYVEQGQDSQVEHIINSLVNIYQVQKKQIFVEQGGLGIGREDN